MLVTEDNVLGALKICSTKINLLLNALGTTEKVCYP